jgi:hypothetical protein
VDLRRGLLASLSATGWASDRRRRDPRLTVFAAFVGAYALAIWASSDGETRPGREVV